MTEWLTIIACAAFAWVAISSLAQSAIVASYTWLLASHRRRPLGETELPKAAVILSMRGPDPFLAENLKGLLQQDYPDYEIFVIIDSAQDPAGIAARELQAAAPSRVHVRTMRRPLDTCSLKCCALAQGVEELDDSFKIVAFLDGDAQPHTQWLRDLAEPLVRDASIGVTTGNRWYMPQTGELGSLVRYFWNAGAVVQVWLQGVVWAGSMAMRMETIRKCGVIPAWRKALSVDATVYRQVLKNGFRSRFVPSVMMVNREEISLRSFVPWVQRQMIAAKSCGSSGWKMVVLHISNLTAIITIPWLTAAWAYSEGNTTALTISLCGAAAYWISAASSMIVLELAVRSVLKRNAVDVRWLNVRTLLWYLPSFFVTHGAFYRMFFGAYAQNRVSWRGIVYEIRGVNDIRLLEYRPYAAVGDEMPIESVV